MYPKSIVALSPSGTVAPAVNWLRDASKRIGVTASGGEASSLIQSHPTRSYTNGIRLGGQSNVDQLVHCQSPISVSRSVASIDTPTTS